MPCTWVGILEEGCADVFHVPDHGVGVCCLKEVVLLCLVVVVIIINGGANGLLNHLTSLLQTRNIKYMF